MNCEDKLLLPHLGDMVLPEDLNLFEDCGFDESLREGNKECCWGCALP